MCVCVYIEAQELNVLCKCIMCVLCIKCIYLSFGLTRLKKYM